MFIFSGYGIWPMLAFRHLWKPIVLLCFLLMTVSASEAQNPYLWLNSDGWLESPHRGLSVWHEGRRTIHWQTVYQWRPLSARVLRHLGDRGLLISLYDRNHHTFCDRFSPETVFEGGGDWLSVWLVDNSCHNASYPDEIRIQLKTQAIQGGQWYWTTLAVQPSKLAPNKSLYGEATIYMSRDDFSQLDLLDGVSFDGFYRRIKGSTTIPTEGANDSR